MEIEKSTRRNHRAHNTRRGSNMYLTIGNAISAGSNGLNLGTSNHRRNVCHRQGKGAEAMTEEWRFVKDNGETCYVYQVSSLGRVKSLRGGEDKIMSTRVNNWGYEIVNISLPKGTKTKQVHRLVAEAFYGWREPKWQVNHKDCNKLNNRLDNLEWTTPKENSTHAKNHGRLSKRSDNLTTREILAIRKLAFDHNMTYQDIADVFDISRRTVAYQMAKKETDTRRQA